MIELDIDGAVARLTLNRPEARNALAVRDWRALADAVRQIASSDARVLVVSGAGGAFCAGADLKEFADFHAGPSSREGFRATMREALETLATLPLATIAWIDGPCFGAGVAVAMACDLRLANPGARFAITPARMGIGYPQEDVARLVALVGPGWAARLLFTGSPIDAETALRIGLVEEVGQDVDPLVSELLACDGASIAMLKRGIGLAVSGIVQDEGQDQRFEALLGSDALGLALSRRGAGRGLPPKGG